MPSVRTLFTFALAGILFAFVPRISSIRELVSSVVRLSSPALMSTTTTSLPSSQAEWRKAFDELPSTPEHIPSFFFAHGSPMLAIPPRSGGPMGEDFGPKGRLAKFLGDFGAMLLKKYKPKGIVIFSAHWETLGERHVTNYGDENPLLYDYYGFPPELYKLKFKSRGDEKLANRVVELYTESQLPARTTSKLETRGEDGRGFSAPGFDHGVFIPLRIMFSEEFMDIPIIQVSIDGSLSPEKNWAAGKAVAKLRDEGILVLSGGLTAHNLRDFSSFNEETAKPPQKDFHEAIKQALLVPDATLRKKALVSLPQHPGFRASHPREDHLAPIWVAAGVADAHGDAKVLSAVYGQITVAFGV